MWLFNETSLRVMASMTNAELIEALLTVNEMLGKGGLPVRISAGMVSLSTTQVESEVLRGFIQDHASNVEVGDLNENALSCWHDYARCRSDTDREARVSFRG